MNRIVLIGNGFDLAHGLPTNYKSFIDSYWKLFSENMFKDNSMFRHETDMAKFEFNPTSTTITFTDPIPPISTFNELMQRIDRHKDAYKSYYGHDGGIKLIFKSEFFKEINVKLGEQKWVDIENEYYRLLKMICFGEGKPCNKPTELNTDLKHIENLLIAYLSAIQQEQIKSDLVDDEIKNKMFATFKSDDISVGGMGTFLEFLDDRLKKANDEPRRDLLLKRFGYTAWIENKNIADHIKEVDSKGTAKNKFHRYRIIERKGIGVPSYFTLPEEVLLLNFNYTKTANLYIPQNSGFRINYIHGELNNPDNPIIFGYGDEMDEDYKPILNLNDNDYLENIKSICYLKTDNYRKLLTFIDSAPYQIIIMGHSCGNSDRTLLNTLFEHKNCLSIKPYYHLKDDGTDNYIDIVQNISRDFNDMTLMRDRVVNKRYCEAMPQNKTE